MHFHSFVQSTMILALTPTYRRFVLSKAQSILDAVSTCQDCKLNIVLLRSTLAWILFTVEWEPRHRQGTFEWNWSTVIIKSLFAWLFVCNQMYKIFVWQIFIKIRDHDILSSRTPWGFGWMNVATAAGTMSISTPSRGKIRKRCTVAVNPRKISTRAMPEINSLIMAKQKAVSALDYTRTR